MSDQTTPPTRDQPPSGATPRSKRWAIQIVDGDGNVMFLRHGRIPGEGRIVQFRSKRDAELNAEAFIAPGLDQSDTVSVVIYDRSDE